MVETDPAVLDYTAACLPEFAAGALGCGVVRCCVMGLVDIDSDF